MDLKAKIQADMKDAMRAKDPVKVDALRGLISEFKKREIDKRSPLDEPEMLKVISTGLKQRQDSIEAFVKGNRSDLADKEKKEVEILSAYMPAQMSRAEVESIVVAAVAETGAKLPSDMGKVMKVVLPKVAGKADGKLVNEIVKSKLVQA